MTKIAIIGPGAVGASLAVALKPHDSVTLLGRKDAQLHFESLQTHEKSQLTVHALADTQTRFDVIFITVKTYQLKDVLPYLSQIKHDQTLIILAQNGYGQLQTIDHPHVEQAVVYISGQKEGQHVTHYRDQRLHIQRNTRTEQLLHALAQTDLTLCLEDDIAQTIWYKLLVNLGINTITALSRDTAKVLKDDMMYTLCRHLLEEGYTIAQKDGITFKATLIDDIIDIYRGYPDQMGTSMYYDVIHQQPLEVEAIQGYLYQRAQHHHLDIPYLEMAYVQLRYISHMHQ